MVTRGNSGHSSRALSSVATKKPTKTKSTMIYLTPYPSGLLPVVKDYGRNRAIGRERGRKAPHSD